MRDLAELKRINRHAAGTIFGPHAGDPDGLFFEGLRERHTRERILLNLVGPVTEREHIAPDGVYR